MLNIFFFQTSHLGDNSFYFDGLWSPNNLSELSIINCLVLVANHLRAIILNVAPGVLVNDYDDWIRKLSTTSGPALQILLRGKQQKSETFLLFIARKSWILRWWALIDKNLRVTCQTNECLAMLYNVYLFST